MLHRIRERSACVALLLAVFFATIGTPHSTDPQHDSDRAIVIVPHDEANHRVQAPDAGQGPHESHCVLCHFVRAFRPRTDARVAAGPSHRAIVPFHVQVFTGFSAALTAQPPLRSPPASPSAA